MKSEKIDTKMGRCYSQIPVWERFKFRQWIIRTHLKNRILVQDRGGAEFKTGGILLYVEDFKQGTNKEVGPKDIFEMGSINKGGMA